MTKKEALDRLTDAQLCVLSRQQLPHVSEAYEILIHRHEKLIFSLCSNICGNMSDAQDAYQEVLLNIFHNLRKFKDNAMFKTWAYRIAYNESINVIRSNERNIKQAKVQEISELDSVISCVDIEIPVFHKLIASLPEEDRSVITLRLISEFEFQEIAEITGTGLSAVKMRYKRALDKLKLLLKDVEIV